MIRVRPVHRLDLRDMAALLEAQIAAGAATALIGPIGAATLRDWWQSAPARSAWHVAEAEDGALTGLQWVEPHDDLPPEACDIATFGAPGREGLGIGSALFAATEPAARALGYDWINAAIRADNTGGLAYYQSRGFRIRGRLPPADMADGARVARMLLRYDLD